MTDSAQQFCRLVRMLQYHAFVHIDRVLGDASLQDLSVTDFLCVMAFFMNLVCFQQFKQRPIKIPFLPANSSRVQITREDRDTVLEHLMNWQKDLKIYPILNKPQLTNPLNSWTKRRAELLIAAMDEIEVCFSTPASVQQSSRRSISLVSAFSFSEEESF